jgi:hypothetical protein
MWMLSCLVKTIGAEKVALYQQGTPARTCHGNGFTSLRSSGASCPELTLLPYSRDLIADVGPSHPPFLLAVHPHTNPMMCPPPTYPRIESRWMTHLGCVSMPHSPRQAWPGLAGQAWLHACRRFNQAEIKAEDDVYK